MTLQLEDRALLHDALRPPHGMEIAAAIGTTYTLDLTALLAIPVAASLAPLDGDDDEKPDLLEVIRRYADRTVLFCQAGAISVPAQYRNALTFVEQTVIEVKQPTGGLFHPKVWALRFEGRGRQHHRILIMTRNLGFDNAFDVIVRLDEDPDCRQPVDVRDLTRALATYRDIAARQPREDQQDLINSLVGSIGRARFAVPEPFSRGRLVAGEPGRRRRPFLATCDNALAVSPFLTADAVRWFLPTATQWSGIVSRRGALDNVAGALADTSRVMRVKDALLNAQQAAETDLDDPALDQTSEDEDPNELNPAASGLHAKLYVQDVGDTSTVWIGSANLTRAAFGTNYEMSIQMAGPTRSVGIDAVLDPNAERKDLSVLVEDHLLQNDSDAAQPDDGDELDDLQRVVQEIASHTITLTVDQTGETWTAGLSVDTSAIDPEVSIFARPLSLGVDLTELAEGQASWSSLDLMSITPFVVLDVRRGDARRQTLVRADLVGDPGHRRDYVLARAITSREDFLRYLAALLGIPYGGTLASSRDDPSLDGFWPQANGRHEQVLEDLLVTASRAGDRLRHLEATLSQLKARETTRDVVPEDFLKVWAAVHRALRGSTRAAPKETS